MKVSEFDLTRFSIDYEAEALEYHDQKSVSGDSRAASQTRGLPAPSYNNHSRRGSDAPSGFNSPAGGGDYYRDTNLTHNNSSNPNLRIAPQGSIANLNASAHGHGSSVGHAGFLPPMGFGTGSEVGHGSMGMGMPMPMPMPTSEFGTMPNFGYAGSAYGGSGYGEVAPGVPRNSVMTNLNMFGGGPPTVGSMGMGPMGGMGFGSMGSVAGHSATGGGFGSQARPMSTFSMATSVNPFMSAPNQSTNPTDEELLSVLRIYLSTQDLMTVTKKYVFFYLSFTQFADLFLRTAREAVMARFPKADLSSKKEFLNQSIERILSET